MWQKNQKELGLQVHWFQDDVFAQNYYAIILSLENHVIF